MSKIINGCAGTGCKQIEETDDYNNRLERVRSQLVDYGSNTAIACEVYNYYGNVANPTSCTIPSQGTGNDGNVLGQYYQDSANPTLSHTASLAYDPTHRLTGAAGAAVAVQMYGGMTAAGQAIGATIETYIPGSVEAATDFVSGIVGYPVHTVFGALSALASYASSDPVQEGVDWVERNLLC